PPTPISLVGREAIHAVLHPDKGKSLYFVADGSGGHIFSNNLKDHNRAVRKYILKK
ncbi:MAG: endolytic transglycosylase MltG, partial [Proteobacteria bacterium]|nr:endolytic transglycosylase MltG [Pseudomonadota bacterium]